MNVSLDENSDRHVPSIGIDIGGTKMLGCLFGEHPTRPLASITWKTDRKNGGAAVLTQTANLISKLRAKTKQPIGKVGIALPELVDNEGKPTSAWNFDWRGLDVQKTLGVDCPVHLESDVRAAAYAESQLSDLKSYDPFLYVTLSTGIAHTLVINGKPYTGARGYALHFSGTDLNTLCKSCNVMTPFNLELFAGGRALGERYSHAKQDPELTARDLFDSYDVDPIAHQMVDQAISSISSYLGQLINTLDPAILVIGGGIGIRPDVFMQLDHQIRKYIWSDHVRDLPIRSSKLDGKAAAIGAVLLANEFQ